MVMAWEKSAPGTLPCYSFGGAFRESQDVVIARQVAKSCEQPHQVIKVGDEFLNRFSRYAERTVYLTDGCADVSRSADLYVNERAREVAPVRMTGNYGGEVLRRVRAFKPAPATAGLFSGDFLPQVQAANAIYARVVEGHPLSFAVFRQAPWHHYGLLELEQTQISTRSPFLDNDFVRTVFRAPDSACASNDVCLRLIADGDAKLSRIRTDRGLAGSQGLLPGALLGGFLEFTFKSEYAYDYGMPQWIAKIDHRLSRLHLERLFLGRHKFYHYRVWYRDVLSNYVREMLLDPRTLSRPYLQPKKLELMVRGHLRGDWNYTSEIHKVLTLELLHRLFVDAR
jgi:asparagine synthase (glutamine-hydrolysing)